MACVLNAVSGLNWDKTTAAGAVICLELRNEITLSNFCMTKTSWWVDDWPGPIVAKR